MGPVAFKRHQSMPAIVAGLLAVACWQAALPSLAAQGPPPAARSQPADNVDIKLSRCYVLVGKTGLGHEHGVEGRLASGRVQLGAAANAGELVFDMTSFVAETKQARTVVGLTGDGVSASQVTTNMLGPSVLNVAKYPEAHFVVQSALRVPATAAGAPPEFELQGEFTLHGVSQPLRVRAQAVEKDGLTRLRGRFSILQTKHGITPYKVAFGTVGVADQLDIWGEIWLAPSR
jgi:polyisoprenoid-binding protein YceI